MNKKVRQVDVAIVGYGIEGRMLAQMISSHPNYRKVVAFDAPDSLNLGADSTRNQSIIHYGILYAENNIVSAKRMLYSAHKMHETAGIPIPDTGGVLAVKESEVEKVFQIAETLKIKSQVYGFSKEKAERQLGKFYKSKPEYLRIPETIFAEELILEKLDFMARDNHVELVKAKVKLLPNPDDETRCMVDTGQEIIESQFLILYCTPLRQTD